MNFKKLSKEKKQHLLLVSMIIVGVLAGLGWGLIKTQYEYIGKLAERRVETEKKLLRTEDAIKRAGQIEVTLAENKKKIDAEEEDMAYGDLYSWIINTLRKFKADYKVEIPQMSGINGPAEMVLLPSFPYKQASITVMGTAHYHDLGRFISDFENQFPHMRLINLGVDVVPTVGGNESEMVSFRMEIITLVKTNPS